MSDQSQIPIASIRCNLTSSHDLFMKEIHRFAEDYAFAIRVGKPRPEEDAFLIQMWREDIKMIGVNPFSVDEVRLSFYAVTQSHQPVDAAAELSEELMTRLSGLAECQRKK